MTWNLMPFLYVLAVMVLAVIVLIVYRQKVASHEDDMVHLSHGGDAVQQQAVVAEKLEHVDRWGKIVTAVTVIYGLILAAAWVYKGWIEGTNLAGR